MAADVPRDNLKRPLIIPPEGGAKVPYQRASSYGDVIDDTYNLRKWEQRHVALGLAARPDLLNLVAANSMPEADPKEEKARKGILNDVADQAKEASGTSSGSNTGTALHKVTERIDKGEAVPILPEPYQRDIVAYQEATQMIEPVHVERFLVCDYLKVAGTTDRLSKVGMNPKLTVVDTKTGQGIDFGIAKIAVQLAIYSRSKGYDPLTGAREDLDIDQDWGMIVHLPSGKGKCELVWVNLQIGWSLALLSMDIRDGRKLGRKELTQYVDFEDLIA